ncbi:PPR domain protein [Medicago truncatula]|uniref:PPR domain protein n=1 Tax=Medicago truncatula TaxID=3880 RepID=G7I5B4_MEDTR|nr:PPR domain protein [Medicago truncatula]
MGWKNRARVRPFTDSRAYGLTWNALIGGHADDKDPNATIQAFNLMRREGLLSNYITVHGMPIHVHIVVAGFELDTYVQSSLITMYAQCKK